LGAYRCPVPSIQVREVRVLRFYAVLTAIRMFGTLERLCGAVDGMEDVWYALVVTTCVRACEFC